MIWSSLKKSFLGLDNYKGIWFVSTHFGLVVVGKYCLFNKGKYSSLKGLSIVYKYKMLGSDMLGEEGASQHPKMVSNSLNPPYQISTLTISRSHQQVIFLPSPY